MAFEQIKYKQKSWEMIAVTGVEKKTQFQNTDSEQKSMFSKCLSKDMSILSNSKPSIKKSFI